MKTALIVDDSRVARAVLRKTLVAYGIAVDEVPSAEAAIEYLKVDRPDVIFLDHMMPGMDGFDALGVLKANPGTATIPVMMYTSQEGQFYVSQARALGAVDVMPKSLAPTDVERVLRSHHLIGEPRWTLVREESAPADGHDDLIERCRSMFDERAVVLLADFRRELDRAHSDSAMMLHRMLEEAKPKSPRFFYIGLAAGSSIAALAAVLTVGLAYVRAGQAPDDDAGPPAFAAMPMPGERDAADSIRTRTEVSDSGPGIVLAAAPRSWNFSEPYPYDATPLDDDRAREFAPLISELKSEGFVGTVTLDIHEGRYCTNYSADGSAQLAPPDQLAAACDFIGTPRSGNAGVLQSPMFANMVAAVTRDGRLSIDTVLHGPSEPIIDYPMLDDSITAGYWNSIADVNHRISVRVGGDDAISSERVANLAR
jgi:CheY-like chemotaxis protein